MTTNGTGKVMSKGWAERKYRCRCDFILYRVTDRGKVGKIHVSAQSAQGKDRVVLAVGEDVKGIAVGDRLGPPIGQLGMDIVPLPDEPDVYLTKQANIALVVLADWVEPEGDGE